MIQFNSKLQIYKTLILALIGGVIYYGIEIMYRGHSHWSMGLCASIAFILIGSINEYLSWKTPLWIQGLVGMITVTTLEFVFGVIFNLWLGLNIWDYSNLKFNLLGQVCLLFSVIWYGLSIVAIIVDDRLRYWLFNEEKPRYKLF